MFPKRIAIYVLSLMLSASVGALSVGTAFAGASAVTWETLPQFCRSNVAQIKGPVRGIAVEHHGLGCQEFQADQTDANGWLAERGIVYLHPHYSPWAWMNRHAVKLTDDLVSAVKGHYRLADDVPIVSYGASMGGQGCLIWPVYSRHRVSAVVANCPVTDLVYHYTERPDLPRTIGCAFAYADDLADEIRKRSPYHQIARMPDIPYTILHGTKDDRVSKSRHSDRFVAALRQAGRRVTYEASEGMGHVRLTERTQRVFDAAILAPAGIRLEDEEGAKTERQRALAGPMPTGRAQEWNEGSPRFKGPRAFGATPNRVFRFSFPAYGSRDGLAFSLVRGELPRGVALDAQTGVLSGRTESSGEWRIAVRAVNAEGQADRDFRLVIGENARSLTPPMGWTSWNALTDDVDQERVKAQAKALVEKGLAAHGYQFVNIDSGWQGQRTAKGTLALQPNAKFPDMGGLVRDIHARGLKAGIYSTPMVTAWGSTPQVVYRGGSDYPLDKQYFHWYFGGCGSVGHEKEDARQFADWGFDWLKYDWPDTDVEHARRMRAALDATGRDIVLQLCTDCRREDAAGFAKYAQQARGNLDTHDDWELMLGKHNCFHGIDAWLDVIRPGFWYDTDMLVVGAMRIDRKESAPLPGESLPASFANRLTRDEIVSHFAWWAIIPSPLFLSCDIERIDPFTLELVTNDDLIDINQDYPATPATYEDYEGGAKRIWIRKLSDGRKVLGFFNLRGCAWKVTRTFSKLVSVRDALEQKDQGRLDKVDLEVPVHGCRVLVVREEESVADASLVPLQMARPSAAYRNPDRIHYQTGPSVAVAPNGRLWVAIMTGGGWECNDNYVDLLTSGDGGVTWSEPKLALDIDGPLRTFDPAMWTDPEGRVWLFWCQCYDFWDGRGGVWASVCEHPDDENAVWSAPHRLCNGVMKNKPLVLRNGDIWLLVEQWRDDCQDWFWKKLKERPMLPTWYHTDTTPIGANVYRSTDRGASWSWFSTVPVPDAIRTCDEHMAVELKDGTFRMMLRVKTGLAESRSADGGRTWSTAAPGPVKNPAGRFYFGRLRSGNILLVKNGPLDRQTDRRDLMAFLSEDDGKTFPYRLELDMREKVSYPDVAQSDDGRIHCVHDFDREGAGEIILDTFTEDDIRAGRLVSPKSRLHRVVRRNAPKAGATPPAPDLAAFRDARFGLFVHWGLYSQLGGRWKGETMDYIGEWIQSRFRIPNAEYAGLAKSFNPTNFDADAWAKAAKDAGMEYVVFTAKHHEGFSMFGTKASDYNVVDATPFGRDVFREVADAFRRQGLKVGFYYSQCLDWHERDAADVVEGRGTNKGMDWGNAWDFPDASQKDIRRYLKGKVYPQLRELLTNYGDIFLVWFDCPQGMTREQTVALREYVRSLSPKTLVSGRIGFGLGDFGSMGDNQMVAASGEFPLETPMTLNDTWGFKYDDHNWKSCGEVVEALVQTISCDANLLLNVGPRPDGRFPEASSRVLAELGAWRRRTGFVIRGTRGSPFVQQMPWGCVTVAPGNVLQLVVKGDWQDDVELPDVRTGVRSVRVPPPTSDGLPRVVRLAMDAPVKAPREPCVLNGSVLLSPLIGNVTSAHEDANGEGKVLGAAAEVLGGGSCRVSEHGTLTAWHHPGDRIAWRVAFPQAGKYRIRLTTESWMHGRPWSGERTVRVRIGDRSVESELKKSRPLPHTVYDRAESDIGVLEVGAPGVRDVTVETVSAGEGARFHDLVSVALETGDVAERPETGLVRDFAGLRDGESLCLTNGIYHITEDLTRKMFLAPSNNRAGEKLVAFALAGRDGVMLDGGGSTLVIHGRVFPFAVTNCSRFTVRNLTITTARPSCAGFTVEASDDEGFAVAFDGGICPYRVDDGHLVFTLDGHDVSTRDGRLSLHALDRLAIHYLLAPDTPGDRGSFPSTFVSAKATDLGDGRVRFRYAGEAHPKRVRLPYAVGEKVVVNLEERRERGVFFFEDCGNVVMENVTIRRFGGMGVVAQRCKDVKVDGLVAEPPEGERVSLTADVMQFVNCCGKVSVGNCRCGFSLDDVINIHGNYLAVESAKGRTVELRTKHASHAGFFPYRAGDALEFVAAHSRQVLAKARVASVEPDPSDPTRCCVAVDADLPALPPGTLVENVTLNPDVTIRGNDFHDHPNLRLSGRGRILVEKNRISRSVSALVGMDLADYWYESGRIADMTVRDNDFIDCNRLGGTTFLEFGVSGWGADAPEIHGRISIENNRFEGVKADRWRASGVRELRTEGNR